jgi:GWxTD domain-containing protein
MRFSKIAALVLICGFFAACGLSMLPSKDSWYAQHYFVMQDFERKIYGDLTDAGRLEFQKLFWSMRTPNQKIEFDRRIAYCNDAFRRENFKQPWNTDRARVYLLNGSPASIDYVQNNDWVSQGATGGRGVSSTNERLGEDIQANTMEAWAYPYNQYIVVYGFTFQPPNKWKAAQMTAAGSRYIGELEQRNKLEVWRPVDANADIAKMNELKSIK